MAKKMIGLEIDQYELRAVELSGDKVEAYGRVALGQGVIEEGFIAKPDEAAKALRTLLKQNSFKGLDVCIGINNQNIIIRMATFRKVAPDKQRNMVLLQAQEFIPLPLSELQLDYVPGDTKIIGQEEHLDVLLVGARKKMLHEIMQLAATSRLNIVDIDAGIMATGRSILEVRTNQVFGIMRFDNCTLSILIYKGNFIAFARAIQLTPQLRQELIGGSVSEVGLASLKEVLATEMTSSLNYYRMQNDQAVEGVYIAGVLDEEILQRLSTHVGGSLGLPTSVPRLYQSLANYLPVQVYATCISLAKKGME
jgi:type IV pilus assembly protein PilM